MTRIRHRQVREAAAGRHRISVVGVLGELLITGGVLVFLFLGWQLWWNDMIVANQQTQAATDISRQWTEEAPTPVPSAAATPRPTEPVVAAPPGKGDPFAVLYVPRFGADYRRTIGEGTGMSVLNSPSLGIGHYPQTQMPGDVGNFAIAAHRSANGGGMHLINTFQLGDPIYVQTADGYYTYRFRELQYVEPSAVEVLAPVPNDPAAKPTDRIISLITCNPLYSTAERVIAYGVFESWQPTSAGPPAELAPIITAQAQAQD